MAVRRVECWIAVCDLCGNTEYADSVIPHLDTPEEAVEYVLANGDVTFGWTRTPGGLLVCNSLEPAHEWFHVQAGKRDGGPGRDAMCVTYSD
ncbi:hypothetical protein AQ490_06520 [Wenjunlia vitaminophila]|uniref:Uncharacterized protein n=1 Tax=Wenjunlia vitaminophila TaxID=76728 RepID=A0A0T6LN70_WENVI|nr:hypothetical protein [Wenjunlia vitaminophila]KRV47546.1 hypothetical protein AQ490_06520 [Wenjunlia vitaminophila]